MYKLPGKAMGGQRERQLSISRKSEFTRNRNSGDKYHGEKESGAVLGIGLQLFKLVISAGLREVIAV